MTYKLDLKQITILPQKKNDLKLKPLKRNNKIYALFRNGLSIHSSSLLLKFKIEEDNLFKEFCFSVSKSKLPRAVDRNRIKRMLREIIRKNYNYFPPGQFLFIYNNNQIPSFSSLCNEIKKLLIHL